MAGRQVGRRAGGYYICELVWELACSDGGRWAVGVGLGRAGGEDSVRHVE